MAVVIDKDRVSSVSPLLKQKYFRSKVFQDRLGQVLAYLFLTMGAILILIPFAWMVSTSLKKPGTEFSFPIQWIPNPPRWENYVRALTQLPFDTWAINSVVITGLSILGNLVSSALVGFGFARIDFPGRNVLFLLVLATLMLPYPSVLIPLFILYKNLGWLDTFKPLVVPTFFGNNAFYIFVMRQFFKTIPKDLDDSARVDGCSDLGIFWHISLPLIKPALGIIAVFSFMAHWNDFLGPLIFLSTMEKYTLAMGLRYFHTQYRVEWALLMAASLVMLSPCLILFFIAQRYYIQGIVVTGLKG
jgi:ABC-type glycerol-3-phosphate transport system permease component